MSDVYEVKVTVGDATVEIKGAEKGVVSIVQALSEILGKRPSGPASRSQAFSPETGTASPEQRGPTDPRSFFQEKSPSTQTEAVAVAAYFISEVAKGSLQSDVIDAARLKEFFRMAKYPLPKRLDQTLVNTRNAGYLDRAGTGTYRLNAVGMNLIEHTLGS